jgi:predicted nucleotidyltransferase
MADAVSAIRTLFESHAEHGVVSVYCFGSQTTGRAHRQSDLDIGVLLEWKACPDPRTRFDARLRLTAAIARAVGRNDIDLVILNDAPPHLGRAIVTRGHRVYCRDDELDHAYVRNVQLRAADLEPFLRRARQVKLAAILR